MSLVFPKGAFYTGRDNAPTCSLERKGRMAMGEGMSRVLIETMVRKGIREMQEDP